MNLWRVAGLVVGVMMLCCLGVMVWWARLPVGQRRSPPACLTVSPLNILSNFSSKIAVSLACGPGDKSVIVADYSRLVIIDEKGEQVLVPLECDGIWNPTSIDRIDDGPLWVVANYNGGNVFVGTVVANHFRCVRSVQASGMRWPEGVSVVPGQKEFVVADYGSGQIFKFDINGRLLWRASVSRAHSHGVLVSGNSVYATDLADRRLLKLSLTTGKIEAVTGKLGRGFGDFLWPTSIDVYDKFIAITDAHQNRITFFDENLRPQKILESEGFNFPYASYQTQRGVVVLNTLNQEILEWDRRDGGFRRFGNKYASTILSNRNLESIAPQLQAWHCSNPYTANYGIKVDSEIAKLFKLNVVEEVMMRPGYNAFSFTNKCSVVLEVALDTSLDGPFFGDVQAYDTWLIDGRSFGKEKIFFGSKQVVGKFGEISLQVKERCPAGLVDLIDVPASMKLRSSAMAEYFSTMYRGIGDLGKADVQKEFFEILERVRPLGTIKCIEPGQDINGLRHFLYSDKAKKK